MASTACNSLTMGSFIGREASFGGIDGVSVQLGWRRTIALQAGGMAHMEDGESGDAHNPGHGTRNMLGQVWNHLDLISPPNG